jgi:hypothetical protein
MKTLLGAIHDTKSALRALAGSAGEAATEADQNGEEEQAEELHKLAGWASTGAGKMRKLLDPDGANLLCELLGQMPMRFPGERYPGERADNAPVDRPFNGTVTISSGDKSVSLTGEQFDRATDEIGSGSERSQALTDVIGSALGRNG